MIIFDIETGPDEPSKLARFLPDFDQKSVKLGNLKDPAKIAEKIESARKKHASDRDDLIERAALSAHTGQVLAIGFRVCDGEGHIDVIACRPRDGGYADQEVGPQTEREMLIGFWDFVRDCRQRGNPIVGWNICGFDLPFLIQRSWLWGVEVPENLLKNGRYWDEIFVDLMQRWACGKYGSFFSLDSVAKFFGQTGKIGDGAEFSRLFNGTPAEFSQAINYLRCDLELTHYVARQMGWPR